MIRGSRKHQEGSAPLLVILEIAAESKCCRESCTIAGRGPAHPSRPAQRARTDTRTDAALRENVRSGVRLLLPAEHPPVQLLVLVAPAQLRGVKAHFQTCISKKPCKEICSIRTQPIASKHVCTHPNRCENIHLKCVCFYLLAFADFMWIH